MTQVAAKIPLSERVNFRLLGFLLVLLLVVGYPMYIYLQSELTGGVLGTRDGYTEVDLKAMSSFEFDQSNGSVNDVPQRWRELNGKKVILRGEIAQNTFSAGKLNQFELVYSVEKCCFSGRPQVQHFVQSKMPAGVEAPFYGGLVEVKGVLKVDVTKAEGQVTGVYHLDVESIKPIL